MSSCTTIRIAVALHARAHVLQAGLCRRKVIGFAVAIGHLCEVGGMAPAGFAGEATEVFHEGRRVPPVKIKRAGKDVDDVWRLLLANVRTPRYNYGDFRALIAAVDLGERRMADVAKKVRDGELPRERPRPDGLFRAAHAGRDRTDPGRSLFFEDVMEDDGITDQPYTIKAEVTVKGSDLVVDYYGSSPQARGPINGTLGVAHGAAYNAILQLTDSTIPKNSGPLPPDPRAGAARHGGERELSRPFGWRQYGDALPDRQRRDGGAGAGPKERSAATDGASHSNFLFGGADREDRRVLLLLRPDACRLGGPAASRTAMTRSAASTATAHTSRSRCSKFRFPWHVED